MVRRPFQRRRRGGAILAEAVLVYPILLMLTVGVIIIGLGVYRYQQVASLARLGSRYACVHGANYASATGSAAATDASITTYITDRAIGLDPNQLSVSVTLEVDGAAGVDWDTTNKSPTAPDSMQNTVVVKVTYNWIPEAYLPHMTLSSTSKVPMSF